MSENDIIEGCLLGKPAAQEAFYKKFGPRMKFVCLRYTRSTFEAEDLFHESLMKIFNKMNTYRSDGSFSAWINKITVHTAIDHYHRENKLRTVYNAYTVEENLSENDKEDLFVQLATLLSVNDLQEMVSRLPEGYRMVFNLYAIENYSHKEIAELLKISEGTSKSQLSKARKHLRQMILNETVEYNERRISK